MAKVQGVSCSPYRVPIALLAAAHAASADETGVAHPDITQQLEAVLAQLPKSDSKHNTLNQIGSNVGVQDVTNSTITITR